MQPSGFGPPCSHTPASTAFCAPTQESKNSPATASATFIFPEARAPAPAPQALVKRKVSCVEVDAGCSASSAITSHRLESKAAYGMGDAELSLAIESLQTRISCDSDSASASASVLLVDGYAQDLPMLYAAALRPPSSANALHLLSLFF